MSGKANAASAPEAANWRDRVPTGLAGGAWLGFASITVFIGLFGYWSATAPLSGAAVAPGVVQASGQNQIIQHYEGGIVREIAVAEGDHVSAGDTMLVLDDTSALAERNRIAKGLIAARAALTRAEAERDGSRNVEFADELRADAEELRMAGDLEQQESEFANRRDRLVAEIAVLNQRIAALREEIVGLAAQKNSEQSKLAVIREELFDKEQLLENGLTSRSQVTALRRAEADSLGRIGGLAATIGQRKATIAETEERRLALSAERREAASKQINDLRTKITDLHEQLHEREDIVARSKIASPVDGVVVKLANNTVGGVVKPGDVIAEILPTSSELIVEARIRPADVDAVQIGQSARLHLAALNARTTPEVDAEVTYLSADRFEDKRTGEPYYVARLAMNSNLPDFLAGQIAPGMPVDAFITTGERTFLEYLVRPMRNSMAKAFREE